MVANTSAFAKCFVCGESRFSLLFGGKIIDEHVLARCRQCGMVQGLLADGLKSPRQADYSDFGDYLLVESEAEVRKQVRLLADRWRRYFELVARRSARPVVLDFGSGAGYLAKAAAEAGFESYGVEVSSKLLEYSQKKVGFANVYPSLEALGAREFDAARDLHAADLDDRSRRQITSWLSSRLTSMCVLIEQLLSPAVAAVGAFGVKARGGSVRVGSEV